MITIIISIILNLLLGTPTTDQSKTTTDSEEQPINTLGGSTGWANGSKDGN